MRPLALAVQLMLGATLCLANDELHHVRRVRAGVVALDFDSDHLPGAAGAVLDARLESAVDAAARMRRQAPSLPATGNPCADTVKNCQVNGCDQYGTQCQDKMCNPGYQWVRGRCLQMPCNQVTNDRWCVDCDRVAIQCTRCVGEFSLAFLRTGVRCGLQADFDDPAITPPGVDMGTVSPPYKGLNWNATTSPVVAGTWRVWQNTTALSNYNFPQIGTVYAPNTTANNRVAISTANTRYSSFILVSGTFALYALPKTTDVKSASSCTQNGILVTGFYLNPKPGSNTCKETVPVPSQSWMLSGSCQGQNLTLVTFEWAGCNNPTQYTFSADDIFFIPNPK